MIEYKRKLLIYRSIEMDVKIERSDEKEGRYWAKNSFINR